MQGKFSMLPSVFVTAAHYRAGLKRDAASVWIEDVTQSSFKVCLRELQNYAGSHEDIYTVNTLSFFHYSPSFSLVYYNILRVPVRENEKKKAPQGSKI